MDKKPDGEVRRQAALFKALAHPFRLQMFLRLKDHYCATDEGECGYIAASELGADLGVMPSTISHHIGELRRGGLIHIKRRGQQIACRLRPEALNDMRIILGDGDEHDGT